MMTYDFYPDLCSWSLTFSMYNYALSRWLYTITRSTCTFMCITIRSSPVMFFLYIRIRSMKYNIKYHNKTKQNPFFYVFTPQYLSEILIIIIYLENEAQLWLYIPRRHVVSLTEVLPVRLIHCMVVTCWKRFYIYLYSGLCEIIRGL